MEDAKGDRPTSRRDRAAGSRAKRSPSSRPAIAAVLACALASPACANRYCITDLGSPHVPNGMNDFGAVVSGDGGGYAEIHRHGKWYTLPGASGGGQAMGINEWGQVAGWAADRDQGTWTYQAVVWQRDMTKTVLEMPQPDWWGFSQAISNTGFVAGYYWNNDLPFHCFLWTPGRGSIDLPNEDRYCFAHGVDDFGRVVGEAGFGDGRIRAFLWKGGRMHDLGTLGGTSSTAHGINARGEVVGQASTAGDAAGHAFLWKGGRMTDIGASQVYPDSEALAINQLGEIVGAAYVGESYEAARFDNGHVVRLADEVENLGDWSLWTATDVNDKGVICGIGVRPSDYLLHTFVLTPVD